MFKIGVGPSSSHTLGPWKAAQLFVEALSQFDLVYQVSSIQIHLFGSLALTGKGHATDMAVQMGLMNLSVETTNSTEISLEIFKIKDSQTLLIANSHSIGFIAERDILFFYDVFLDFHSNGLKIIAKDEVGGTLMEKVYFSIGGGFVIEEGMEEINDIVTDTMIPFPMNSAKDLLKYCDEGSYSISQIVLKNELAIRSEEEIKNGILNLWNVMSDCAWESIQKEGFLPGGLDVKRRAAKMNQRLLDVSLPTSKVEWLEIIKNKQHSFNQTLDWINMFALAINEENASLGKVVTAPTNGAAGVVPSVLFYHLYLNDHYNPEDIINYILVAGQIGSLFKHGATISAAMGGCQAEIGVSSAMAAAGLTEVRGGNPAQCLMAAEIAMEHHLGLTCDPIQGLVQIPCIERNSIGAIKAISASNLAMNSTPSEAKVTLDDVIKSMWKTAQVMHSDYKETSRGGLASTVGMAEC